MGSTLKKQSVYVRHQRLVNAGRTNSRHFGCRIGSGSERLCHRRSVLLWCRLPFGGNLLECALGRLRPTSRRLGQSTSIPDLLAAARALCGKEKGIACILGTGSNSCYYDGEKIVDNVSPLGYILGDEGSGAVLGKLLVGDVLKNQLPKELCDKFLKEYDLDRMKIIEAVYKKPAANRFLASLSPFLNKNIEEPSIHRLVLNAFKAFFVRNIENYENYKSMPVSFVGSVAYYYRDVLAEAAKALDITIGVVIKSPMEGLLKYHSN